MDNTENTQEETNSKRNRKLDKTQPIIMVLHQLFKSQRWGNGEFADLLIISPNHLSQIFSGNAKPSYDVLDRMCKELGYELTVRKLPRILKNPRKKEKVEA